MATLHVLRSFLTNMSWPFHQSMLMTTTVPEERATAVGSGFAVWGFTNGLGPLVSGALLGVGVAAVVVGGGVVGLQPDGGAEVGQGLLEVAALGVDVAAVVVGAGGPALPPPAGPVGHGVLLHSGPPASLS